VPRYVVLLRGVNLAGRNRVSMPVLRETLADEGFEDVVTHLQSGNVVLTTRKSAKAVATGVERVLADRFGLETSVLVRTRAQLAAVVKRNPLAKLAKDPKRLLVTFVDGRPKADVLRKLEATAAGGEQVVLEAGELYAWHPKGVGRSKLAALMSGKGLGVPATARNWDTVTKLLELSE
jgi:uncharacterized protein (DUF1697 family)